MSETQQPKLCRADVNRANAAHSTGPRTPEGKEKSKRNSFKHGLYSRELVLPHENPTELDRLRDRLRAEHQPANETESILVNEIAENFWRLRRMREYEARAMQPENLDKWFDSGLLTLVARQMASAERGMYKAVATLRRLQKDRGFVPSISANGGDETDSAEDLESVEHLCEEPFEEFTWITNPEAGFVPPFHNRSLDEEADSGVVPPHHTQDRAA